MTARDWSQIEKAKTEEQMSSLEAPVGFVALTLSQTTKAEIAERLKHRIKTVAKQLKTAYQQQIVESMNSRKILGCQTETAATEWVGRTDPD